MKSVVATQSEGMQPIHAVTGRRKSSVLKGHRLHSASHKVFIICDVSLISSTANLMTLTDRRCVRARLKFKSKADLCTTYRHRKTKIMAVLLQVWQFKPTTVNESLFHNKHITAVIIKVWHEKIFPLHWLIDWYLIDFKLSQWAIANSIAPSCLYCSGSFLQQQQRGFFLAYRIESDVWFVSSECMTTSLRCSQKFTGPAVSLSLSTDHW